MSFIESTHKPEELNNCINEIFPNCILRIPFQGNFALIQITDVSLSRTSDLFAKYRKLIPSSSGNFNYSPKIRTLYQVQVKAYPDTYLAFHPENDHINFLGIAGEGRFINVPLIRK